MGCDIHCYYEKKNEKGEWESIQEWETENDDAEYYAEQGYSWAPNVEYIPFNERKHPEISRWYFTFGLLTAGEVRSNVIPRDIALLTLKGLPDDTDQRIRARFVHEDCDAHSESYITLEELEKFKERAVKWALVTKYGYTDALNTALEEVHKSFHAHVEGEDKADYRMVFWFDN